MFYSFVTRNGIPDVATYLRLDIVVSVCGQKRGQCMQKCWPEARTEGVRLIGRFFFAFPY
jgi:hypothetical protein